jgi:hypothetical protein
MVPAHRACPVVSEQVTETGHLVGRIRFAKGTSLHGLLDPRKNWLVALAVLGRHLGNASSLGSKALYKP